MKPSSKNTGSEPPTNLPAVVPSGHLARGEEPSLVNSQIATLQGQLVEEQDARKEERFLWFAVTGLLFDVITFMAAGAVAGAFVSMVYLALLLVLSKRWGFEDLWEALYAARDLIGNQKDGAEEKTDEEEV